MCKGAQEIEGKKKGKEEKSGYEQRDNIRHKWHSRSCCNLHHGNNTSMDPCLIWLFEERP